MEAIEPFEIYELKNAQCKIPPRQYATAICYSGLATAKRNASRLQNFQDTALLIVKSGRVVATKENGVWQDCEES